MKEKIIGMLIGVVLDFLSPKQLVEFADMALDFIEDKVAESGTTLDDKIVLPVCNLIREAFNIPDND